MLKSSDELLKSLNKEEVGRKKTITKNIENLDLKGMKNKLTPKQVEELKSVILKNTPNEFNDVFGNQASNIHYDKDTKPTIQYSPKNKNMETLILESLLGAMLQDGNSIAWGVKPIVDDKWSMT
jgi:hypothetical protein